MITIEIKDFGFNQEHWLAKNVGPRMHYLHSSIGGRGWIAKRNKYPYEKAQWSLTFEDEKFASWFLIMFPQ